MKNLIVECFYTFDRVEKKVGMNITDADGRYEFTVDAENGGYFSLLISDKNGRELYITPDSERKASLYEKEEINLKLDYESQKKLTSVAPLTLKKIIEKEDYKKLDTETLNEEFRSRPKKISKLFTLLEKSGAKISPKEMEGVKIGDDTEKIIKELQQKFNLNPDGKISANFLDKLENEQIKNLLSQKKQIRQFQNTLIKALKIANLDLKIDEKEVKEKIIGNTCSNAVKALQKKYSLQPTGEIDKATFDKIKSISVSKGIKKSYISSPKGNDLNLIKKSLRFNMKSEKVKELQKILTYLGYPISTDEYNNSFFGVTTREAVKKYQNSKELPENGHFEAETRNTLNREVIKVNPNTQENLKKKFRIRGTLRDKFLLPIAGQKVRISEMFINKTGSIERRELKTKESSNNGFFDISFLPNNPKDTSNILVELVDKDNSVLKARQIYNVKKVKWINFNNGEYRGRDEYSAVEKQLRGCKICELKSDELISYFNFICNNTKLSPNLLLQMVCAKSLVKKIQIFIDENEEYFEKNQISYLNNYPEIFYGLLGENFPLEISTESLKLEGGLKELDAVLEDLFKHFLFNHPDILKDVIEKSISHNLIPNHINDPEKGNVLISDILESLEKEIIDIEDIYALKKYFFFQNISLDTLLEIAEVPKEERITVSRSLVESESIGTKFWEKIKGFDSYEKIKKVILLARIFENTLPIENVEKTIRALYSNLKMSEKASLYANYTDEELKKVLKDANLDEKMLDFAQTRKNMDKLFPMVSLAFYSGWNQSSYENIYSFLYENEITNFDSLKLDGQDMFKDFSPEDEDKGKLRSLLRVFHITVNPLAGSILIKENYDSALKIYYSGKDQLIKLFKKNQLAERVALDIYEQAGAIYMALLAAQIENNKPGTNNKESILNLENLFGSGDYYSVKHCESLYGPAAYLADIFRFLKSIPHKEKDSVFNVLDERRPDLGLIKLNCNNSEKSMPYIDIVCEILENFIEDGKVFSDEFSYDSKAETKELLAFPQNINKNVYEKLAQADYPIFNSFNLWEEKIRIYLNHLGIPWTKLMEIFQQDEGKIAKEFFNLSSKEFSTLLEEKNDPDCLNKMWGLERDADSLEVLEFLKAVGLSYEEFLEMVLNCKYVSGDTVIFDVKTDVKTTIKPDLGSQRIKNLTTDVLDRIQKFIRLWKKTGWEMWELDLLIRNEKIGDGKIGKDTIINLMNIKKLHEKLSIPAELLLTYYGEINNETRQSPVDLSSVQPLFKKLFKEKSDNFTSEDLIGAFTVCKDDFDYLKEKILSNNPSEFYRYISLNRSLKVSQEELWKLMELIGINPFNSPKDTLDFLDKFDEINKAKFGVRELEYVLTPSADSPVGLKTEDISMHKDNLEKMELKEDVISYISSNFSIKDTLVRKLIEDWFGDNFTVEELVKDVMSIVIFHRASFLISKLKISEETLEFFHEHSKELSCINLLDKNSTFMQWSNLINFIKFKKRYPGPGDLSLELILENVIKEDNGSIGEDLLKLTGWKVDISNFQSIIKNKDLASSATYLELIEITEILKRLGTDLDTAEKIATLPKESSLEDVCNIVEGSLKAKYEYDNWLEIIKPLQDIVREKKRKILVDYILREKSDEFLDSNDMFNRFLIDVEMSSCQPTSRIKSAISSVQLFIQRCLLNLELESGVEITKEVLEDRSSKDNWSQWKWMKNYRVWEANRKIFFYPENWIVPELRDNKSEFFKEFENELMQSDINNENVENAFLNYLDKVHEVSFLEVCGIYHEIEDLNHSEHGNEIDILHVIARTKTDPPIYYYRTFDLNSRIWSSWEKIDQQIDGDHVTPIVYNRKLHLFWLIFVEKPQKLKKMPPLKGSDTPQENPDPGKVLEIQLAWCTKKSTGWNPKKISSKKLIHPWERPHFTYQLRPEYIASENELQINIYLSTSKEFNDKMFYDQELGFNRRFTRTGFSEYYLPWYSSSFIFNGDVKEVWLRGLTDIHNESSYVYVHENFGDAGTKILPAIKHRPRLRLPNGVHAHNNLLINNSSGGTQVSIIDRKRTKTLLKKATGKFTLTLSNQDKQFDSIHPAFYSDEKRGLFINPDMEERGRFDILPFSHSFTTTFIRELNRYGVDGLLNRKIQINPAENLPKFSELYDPTPFVKNCSRVENVDFSYDGAYSIYNWELFFHIPLMIAIRLSQNQRFEESMKWFHYIFNPTNIQSAKKDDEPQQKYWITKPFYELKLDEIGKQDIAQILADIKKKSDQLIAWRNNPFMPHLIARCRPVAYEKYVVMKYINNLIDWGDQLFRRDTLESINEASLLYILAYEILGRRPQKIPNINSKQDKTGKDLMDEFGNILMASHEDELGKVKGGSRVNSDEDLPYYDPYFGIPYNDEILTYWDKIEDRLFKIRYCMNIEGIKRQLPLFEPPIDPALLVKAAAAGVDIGNVINGTDFFNTPYRFRVLYQKAVEFCNEVKAYGEKLLTLIEKKDGEGLALLRSTLEISLLEKVSKIKQDQIEEAEQNLENLNKVLENAQNKETYYKSLIDEGYSNLEVAALALTSTSLGIDASVSIGHGLSSILRGIPQFSLGGNGVAGTPHAAATFGGEQLSGANEYVISLLGEISRSLEKTSGIISTVSGYERRRQEWEFQHLLAETEIKQIQYQINSTCIRKAIAEKEKENHELQIENAKKADEYMRNKYSNMELYSWMISQTSASYFQTYKLAFKMAKTAENAYKFELGEDSNLITEGYWENLRKGLLAGDKLMLDLRILEKDYLTKNTRRKEQSKNISLTQRFPDKLFELKTTGTIKELKLEEIIFDMDYPGDYMRQIKSVSISIPCITGPYTNINCTLALTSSSLRKSENRDDATINEVKNYIPSSISTSTGQNDSGVFELNFNDDRYLPFEGAGAISTWNISLPKETNYFDFSTISDVILHIKYTAKNCTNESIIEKVKGEIGEQSKIKAGLFSLKYDFSKEWSDYFNPENSSNEFELNLKREHYPYFTNGDIYTKVFSEMNIAFQRDENSEVESISVNGDQIGKDESKSIKYEISAISNPDKKPRIKITDSDGNRLERDAIKDIYIYLHD